MPSIFLYSQEPAISYDWDAIIHKIDRALPILKNHAWPLTVSKTIRQNLHTLEKNFNVLKNTKKSHKNSQDFLNAKSQVALSIEQILQTLEATYYDSSKNYDDLHSYIVHHHTLYYDEIKRYYELASQLFSPIRPVPPLFLPSVADQINHFCSLADSDRKDLALKQIALTLAIEERSHSDRTNTQSELICARLLPSKDLEDLNRYKQEFLNMKKKNIPDFLKKLGDKSEKAKKRAMWMENRLCYLNNKPLKHPIESSLEAMLTYLNYWIERYLMPQAFLSQEHKALLFGQKIQDIKEYTQAWHENAQPRSGIHISRGKRSF